jgi:hypothetical protein
MQEKGFSIVIQDGKSRVEAPTRTETQRFDGYVMTTSYNTRDEAAFND